MKKILCISGIFLAGITLFTGCEKDPILFDSSMNVVGFSETTLTLTEIQGGSVTLYLGAPAGAEATVVTLNVITEGIVNPAMEGTDFTISSKEVTVAVGTTSVEITPIDNDVFEGNKSFKLSIASNSKGYNMSKQKTVLVTINDDEHPLKNWIGEYSVAAVSYDGPGVYDEAWNVSISPVVDNVDRLQILGVAGSDQPVIAAIDKDNLTITISPAQPLGLVYGSDYGAVGVFYGGNLKDITWSTPSPELYSEAGATSIIGTISEDGSGMLIDNWAHLLTDYSGFIYDVFNTTWTKK